MENLVEAIKRKEEERKTTRFDWREFGEEIARDYNQSFVYSALGEGFKLQLFYGSETSPDTYFKSHLVTDALVYLIQEADLHLWEKGEDEVHSYQFWGAILKAVAGSYRVDWPHPGEISDADILRQLILDLEQMSRI